MHFCQQDRNSLIIVYEDWAPVIEVNVDDDQVSDRIDDALQHWNEYHFDGTERTYVKHKLTGSTLTLTGSATFTAGETITGGTSGAESNSS